MKEKTDFQVQIWGKAAIGKLMCTIKICKKHQKMYLIILNLINFNAFIVYFFICSRYGTFFQVFPPPNILFLLIGNICVNTLILLLVFS